MVKIAALVIAYNEEKTIGPIVKTLADSGFFNEVIVISDGSTDETAEISRRSGATLVHQLPIKGGKGAAMLHGLTHTDAQLLFFADADLIGFSKDHIEAIVRPVLDGKKVMNVGLRDRGSALMKLASHMPLIGGERAMMRHVIENINPEYLQGFMIESALNYHCRRERLPYGTVPCPGLTIRKKIEKVGLVRGLGEYLKMIYQIVKAMTLVRCAAWRGCFLATG